jgi:tetratricopeptide (TPR) repeat protein
MEPHPQLDPLGASALPAKLTRVPPRRRCRPLWCDSLRSRHHALLCVALRFGAARGLVLATFSRALVALRVLQRARIFFATPNTLSFRVEPRVFCSRPVSGRRAVERGTCSFVERSNLAVFVILFVHLLAVATCALAQSPPSAAAQIAHVKQLYDSHEWNAVVQTVPESPDEPADLELYRGLALAQLHRWDDAKSTFKAGLVHHPHDARLMVELAGVLYQQKKLSSAKHYLRHAVSIEPTDSYSSNFLASIYFLEGNLEAALKYWNRVGKPRLADLAYSPQPSIDPLILDRAFDFSRGSVWTRSQFITTEARLDALDLFPLMQFDLQPQPNDSFDLLFRESQRAPWTRNYLVSAFGLLRGLPFETVYPAFYNVNGAGLNLVSLLRWDDQKRRITTELAAPLFDNPALRYRVYFDARDENWNVTDTLLPAAPANARFNMERVAAGAELRFIESGRWQWSMGGEYTDRLYRTLTGIPAPAAPFFTAGSSVALFSTVQRSLIRFPERRFTLDGGASGQVGTFFTKPLGRYARLQSSLFADWFPQAQGDDYHLQARVRAGGTFGQVPLDDLFVLGFDRDTDLWMRGYPGLHHGQKGNAPLGRDYFLTNWDFDKTAYVNPFFTATVGPFFDSGDAYDPSGYFGSRRWMWDSGLQTKIRVLHRAQIILGWAITLRSARSSFFATVSP